LPDLPDLDGLAFLVNLIPRDFVYDYDVLSQAIIAGVQSDHWEVVRFPTSLLTPDQLTTFRQELTSDACGP